MENTIATEVSLRTRADYKAAIEQCLTVMQRLHEQMERDQEDIDRLRAETKALLDELKAALSRRHVQTDLCPCPAVAHTDAGCPEAQGRAQRAATRTA